MSGVSGRTLCTACRRSSATSRWLRSRGEPPACPHCGAAPPAGFAASEEPCTRIEGQCPRCGTWFDADDWFDRSAPLPSCPRCRLTPSKLAYVNCSGKRVERLLALQHSR